MKSYHNRSGLCVYVISKLIILNSNKKKYDSDQLKASINSKPTKPWLKENQCNQIVWLLLFLYILYNQYTIEWLVKISWYLQDALLLLKAVVVILCVAQHDKLYLHFLYFIAILSSVGELVKMILNRRPFRNVQKYNLQPITPQIVIAVWVFSTSYNSWPWIH